MALSMDTILKSGFAKCHGCKEPLRSIALIDVFRPAMELQGTTHHQSGSGLLPAGFMAVGVNEARRDMFGGAGSSLVQEAEDALARGQLKATTKAQAILEFTHAINAVNYMASSTNGTGLVLRAKDILLSCHCLRAELEDNQTLAEAILRAFPKASVRTSTDNPVWYLSKSAYESLYYQLPANVMAGSPTGTFACVDQRSQSLDGAFTSALLKQQMTLLGLADTSLLMQANHPHCDGQDALFSSLNGTWRGTWCNHATCLPSGRRLPPPMSCGAQDIVLIAAFQFINVFPTDLAASEYARLRFEGKNIGEEGKPLNAKDKPALAKLVKKKAKELGVQDLKRVYVLKAFIPGTRDTLSSLSVMLAVGNIAVKLYLGLKSQNETTGCLFAAKVIAYMELQLKKYRSIDRSSLTETHHASDLTMCAYCGKEAAKLKSCSRCHLAMYCGVDCQKQHWLMKGQFGHAKFCKKIVKANQSSS